MNTRQSQKQEPEKEEEEEDWLLGDLVHDMDAKPGEMLPTNRTCVTISFCVHIIYQNLAYLVSLESSFQYLSKNTQYV